MAHLNGKHAIITGGARGIGAGITSRLLQDGATVTVWDLADPSDELIAYAATIGATARLRHDRVDTSEASSVDAAADRLAEDTKGPWLVVNNAAIAGPNHRLHEYPVSAWHRVVEVNLLGVFHVCHALVPQMAAAGGGGRIVNIASIAGKEGNPLASAYSAAKGGVIALTKSLGKELIEEGILVNCIAPAAIETEFLKQSSPEFVDYMISKIPMARLGQIAEVAALVAWLGSEECSFSTGAVFDISGGRATY